MSNLQQTIAGRILVPRSCKLREEIESHSEMPGDSCESYYQLRCAFTRNTCCEAMGIYCPMWKIVNEGDYEP